LDGELAGQAPPEVVEWLNVMDVWPQEAQQRRRSAADVEHVALFAASDGVYDPRRLLQPVNAPGRASGFSLIQKSRL
jgi:hypothetical protein